MSAARYCGIAVPFGLLSTGRRALPSSKEGVGDVVAVELSPGREGTLMRKVPAAPSPLLTGPHVVRPKPTAA